MSTDARDLTKRPLVAAMTNLEKDLFPFARRFFFTDIKSIKSEMKADDLEREARRMEGIVGSSRNLLTECRVAVATTIARAKELKRGRA